MTGSSASVDSDLFYGIYDGVFRAQLIRLALQLDLFTALASRPQDAPVLARAVGADADGIARLADYLVAIALLERSQGRYALTPTARTFLVRTSPSFAGDLVDEFTAQPLWDRVLASVRSGEPVSLLERFDEDAWVESYRTARLASSLQMWTAAGLLPWTGLQIRVLDLASGCGIKSFSLAQAVPSARVTLVDAPDVLAVARDLAGRMGIAERITLTPADLLAVELGQGAYEACLAGQITHYLTRAQDLDLFGRVRSALAEGGTFVLDVPMGDAQPDETAAFLSLVLLANSGGTAYRYEDYEGMLRSAGFGAVRRIGERWVAAAA